MKWTPEQFRSITTTGKSLLVSAAAGSGKTAVLAERCAYLVCDAPDKCDVDELLVVTFTKAAAAEMRVRIEQTLRKRLGDSEDPRLSRQLLLLDRAQITTLHGFCQSILRRHFHILGLDPSFRVMDQEENWLLKLETARALFDERYESDSSGEFQTLINLYGNGDDQAILRKVISLNELMGSVVDQEGWLKQAALDIAEAKNARPLVRSKLGGRLAENVRRWIGDIRGRWIHLAGQLDRVDGLEAYGEYVNEMIAGVETLQAAFGKGDFDALSAEFAQFKAPTLPRMKNPPPEKEHFQALIGAIRDQMNKGPLAEFCCFSEQQWRDGLAAIYEPARAFVSLVRDFGKRFSDAKRALRGIDFTDLERFTLQILRERNKGADLTPSQIARSYHTEFKHVLVDEYQDINDVQDAILKLVSRESAHADPKPPVMNLFTVGDVKQSIYRFRLAQPDRFLKRYDSFSGRSDASAHPTGAVIDLSANFRSRGPLLNVINSVFERLMTRDAVEIEYDASHRLVAGATYPPGVESAFHGSPAELHLLPPPPKGAAPSDDGSDQDLDRSEREASFVAKRIVELMSSGVQVAEKSTDGLVLRPLRYRDIVVLLRSMKYKSEQFAGILRAAGIPVHTDSGTGFFQSMEIRDMLALLRLLDNQQQDIPLAAVLRSPLSGLADADDCLARIRLAYPDRDAIPFHQAVVKYAQEQDDELSAQLQGILRRLSEWRRLAHLRPLAEVLWQIYDTTGYLAFCSGMQDGQQRVANLIEFHSRAAQFSTFQRQGLSRFMAFLDSLAEDSDLGQPSVASEADDVVRIISIHRSKGLEFPVVFLPDLGKQHNMQDAAGSILVDRDAGIGLMVADPALRVRYPSLAHVLVQQRIKRQTLSEEMRVLYVAMTRAREHLIMVGSCDEDSLQNWREDWSGHEGKLPSERILGGRTMLDWIGPTAAALETSTEPDKIEMTQHTEDEIVQWTTASAKRFELSDAQARLARLEPLVPAPKMGEEAARLRQMLTMPYPHQHYTQVAAATSVGAMTKHHRSVPAGERDSRDFDSQFEAELDVPRCMLTEKRISGAEAGSAMHLFLEHIDYARPCDTQDLADQLATLVTKKLIDPALASSIDRHAIVWLMSTDLGALLRKHAATLRRELPVNFPLVGVTVDQMDNVMVRGRIDVLIPDRDGLIIVDFKTDRVDESTVDARADFYAAQIATYRAAVKGIVATPVKSAALVFFAAKAIRYV